jgi:2-oxoglutarate ferredoxin oxidoreductase subunit gamma
VTKIRIAGFGGQGVILAGELLANAAVFDGKEGSAIGSYGSAARGGLTCSEIVVSNEFIDAPFAEQADIHIVMSQEGYEAYFSSFLTSGIVIVNSGMIKEKNLPNQYLLPATSIAVQELKSPVVANMIMLGALSAISNVVSKHALIKVIEKTVNKKFLELNLKGIEIGFAKGSELIKQRSNNA